MIHKINTNWMRAVVDGELTTIFPDAWASVINSLNGTWGLFNYRPFTSDRTIEMQIDVSKNRFIGEISTTLEGSQVLTMPYNVQGFARVLVETVVGGVVTASTVYVIEQSGATTPETLNLNLSTGQKLITVSGIARRT